MAFASPLPADLSTTQVRPAPGWPSYLGTLACGALALFSFPGWHVAGSRFLWDGSLWYCFLLSSLTGLGLLAELHGQRQAAGHFKEYGLSHTPTRRGEALPVWLHLQGGPRGCQLGDLAWTLECEEILDVEYDYVEGVITRPTCQTLHESCGRVPLWGLLAPTQSGAWSFLIPLPDPAPSSHLSEQEEVGAITWRLSLSMEVPGQPPLTVRAAITVLPA